MATAAEAGKARTPLGADLKAGVDAISYNQEITFTQYQRTVSPFDGLVYWVNGALIAPPLVPATRTVQGSLHYATERRQDEFETFAVNRVVFTAQKPIDFFNDVAPATLFIAEYNGVRFAFSGRKNLYKPQANLWHYHGDAIYADMVTQVIDTSDALDAIALVLSNSVPIWLSLNTFDPDWPFWPDGVPATIYPSFLVPQNLAPPYIVVHVGEEDTSPMVSTQGLGATSTLTQAAIDKVTITTWGLTNAQAQQFVALVNQYSYDTGNIGVMNAPIPRDAKRLQTELAVIGQKKLISFEVSYLQGTSEAAARKLITSAPVTFDPDST